MGQRIEIRRAVHEDAQAMADYTAALAEERLDTLILDQGVSREDWERVLEDFAQDGRAFSLLALDNGRIVGMIDLKAGRRSATRHGAALGMSVAEGYRGQGIGRRLLQGALDEARAWAGFCRVDLEVTSWNEAAIALYRSFGFEVEGIKRRAVNRRGAAEDMLLMALVW